MTDQTYIITVILLGYSHFHPETIDISVISICLATPNAYRLFGNSIAGSIIEEYSIRVDADTNVENKEIRFVYNLTIASIDDIEFQNINTIAGGVEL